LVEDERPSSRISPSTCRKIRYDIRSDTAVIVPEHRSEPITAGRACATFWNPTGTSPCPPTGTTHNQDQLAGFKDHQLPASEPVARPVHGCMRYDGVVNDDPGKVTTVSVDVIALACGQDALDFYGNLNGPLTYRAQEQLSALAKARGDGKISDDQFDRQYLEIYNAAMGSGATEVMQSVTIESRVQVTLAAPLFDGTIAPVADEVQVFDATHTSGKWEWQLKPNTPDTYQLPLVLRIYDPTGKEVLAEGQILNVTVNVPYTASYGINKVWTEVAAFFTSLQGVIASIGAIAAGTAGFRAWDVHRAKRKKVPEPKPEPEAGPTSGYL
jgi:hypothetical protein